MTAENQRLRRRLEGFTRISQAILEGHPVIEIAGMAIEFLAGLISSDLIQILLKNDDSGTATVLAEKRKGKKVSFSPSATFPVTAFGNLEQLQIGIPHQIADISSLDEGHPAKEFLAQKAIGSYVVVPLVVKSDVIGFLNIGRETKNGFDQNELNILSEVGAHIALSICQAKMNEENRMQRDELSTLLHISRNLASSLDLNEIMQTTINESTRVMGLETGAIYLINGEQLYLGATTPPLPADFPEKFKKMPLEDHPHINAAITGGDPIYLPDTETAELTKAEKEVSIRRGLRSLLYVPLQVSSRKVGVLIMGTTGRTKEFSNNEINLCRTFSSQMALAVENARLFQETQLQAIDLEKRVGERTAELRAFTHAISHDLRAPLRAIQGYGQALEEDYGESLDEEASFQLNRMVSASQQLEGMFEALLSLSRVDNQILDLKHLDIFEIAEEILEARCQLEKDRRIEFSVHASREVSRSIFSDRKYVEILLSNLISNAIKFTQERDPARIELGCYVEDGEEIYYLKDNGIGFDMAFEPMLFLPFKRLHPIEAYDGYGIGLTLVKKIVELHDGKIWVDSTPGEGTIVRFKLKGLKPAEQPLPAWI